MQKRNCVGLCKKYHAKKPTGVGRYEDGQFRCQICELYITIEGTKKNEGIFCKCCNYKVRGKPRNKIYKEKLRQTHSSKTTKKICPHCGLVADGDENIEKLFGFRDSGRGIIPQSYCRKCRTTHIKYEKKDIRIKKTIISKEDADMIQNLKKIMKTKHENIRDVIHIFTALYDKHRTVSKVSEISEFSEKNVRKYVKYSRLPSTLQNAVKNGDVDLTNALRATDILNWDGDKGMDDKIFELSMKMKQFTPFQKNTIEKILRNEPSISISAAEKLMKKSTF